MLLFDDSLCKVVHICECMVYGL